MINEIKGFIAEHLGFLAHDEDNQSLNLQLASIALLLEMVIIEGHDVEVERELVINIVKKSLELNSEQANEIIETAEARRQQATDYFEFTSLINARCSTEQKVQLIESLWRIANVDDQIDEQEEYLVRKIANLLHVSHADFILTKIRIAET